MDIQEIKTSISIYDVLDMYNIRYHLQGGQEMIRCPFHNDTSPSCRIYPDYNKLHCFGACNRSFDIFDVVMEKEECSLQEAAKILQETFGIEEIKTKYISRFWDNLDRIKKHNNKRDRLDLAFNMMRALVDKYWPDVNVKILTPVFIAFDEIVEKMRGDELEGTDDIRKWYKEAVSVVIKCRHDKLQ